MSGVLNKLKGFKKALDELSFAHEKIDAQRIHDQFALINLKRMLKEVIEESEDDFEVLHAELLEIAASCPACFDEKFNKITIKLKSYCESVSSERNALLQDLLAFIYDCKLISNPAIIDFDEVDPRIAAICKKLFDTQDMVAYIHKENVNKLFEVICQFHFFSQQQFHKIATQYQQTIEHKLSKLSAAAGRTAPKLTSAPVFALNFAHTLQSIASSGYVTGSAPISPTKPDVEIAGRSRSVPNSAKAQKATERATFAIPPQRERSSSAVPKRQTEASTSSTALVTDPDAIADDFSRLTMGPSSKSQDDSEDYRERKSPKI